MDTTGLLDTDEVLKPLLEAAKEAGASNVSTVRAVVMKAFSHPSIFCGFDQIKAAINPAVTAGGGSGDSSTGESLLRTLDLFSYGRYGDYVNNTSSYINLTETQLTKLRQLTVLSTVQDACSRGENEITYSSLAHELGFVGSGGGQHQQQELLVEDQQDDETSRLLRQVEQVLISCMYAQILDGRLCQRSKKLIVSSHRGPPCRARDVPLTNLPIMIETLQALHQRLESSYAELESAQASVQTSVNKNTSYWNSVEDRKKKAEAQAGDHRSSGGSSSQVRSMAGWPSGSGGPGASGGGDGADSRRSSGSRRQSKRSRGGLGGSLTEPFQRY